MMVVINPLAVTSFFEGSIYRIRRFWRTVVWSASSISGMAVVAGNKGGSVA